MSHMFLTSLFFVREMTKRKVHLVGSQQIFAKRVNERTLRAEQQQEGSRGSDFHVLFSEETVLQRQQLDGLNNSSTWKARMKDRAWSRGIVIQGLGREVPGYGRRGYQLPQLACRKREWVPGSG